MSHFVSYAQNCEDVVLWRALKDVERGFYVDCGAYHPTRHSVTCAFYERGWRGINVEPVSSLLDNFIAQRPRDINLATALSDGSQGTAEFYEIAGSGLSTLDPVVARHHARVGFGARKTKVRTTTLSEVLEEFAPSEIHFIKIDVEGAERLVLSGMNFTRFRPWIVVVEATRPLTQEISASTWEYLLLDAGYAYAYFDGLNRFYVASEHYARAAVLAIPPNVFDHFVNLEQAEEINRVRASYENSISWRVTAPLRAAKAVFAGLRGGIGPLAAAGAVRLGALRSIVSESSLGEHLDERPVMMPTRRAR
jgi:FkbM family methyltransferase